MKKVLGTILMIALASFAAQAATESQTVIVTNAETAYVTFDQAHGLLEKIEYVKTGLGSNTITVATFDGTTANETFFTKALVGATRGFSRTRVLGTTSAGVTLAYGLTGGSDSNETQVITVPYEKPFVSGVQVQAVATAGVSTNVITIYYTPVGK
jgi:opacity protein-like surface antigen